MASKNLDDQSDSSHAKGRVIDLSKMGQQSGSMKAEGTWTKGVRNQVMAVWPQKILIYLFGHFGPWNWNPYIPPTTHWPSKSLWLVKKRPSDHLFFSGAFWQTFASTKCLFSFQRFTLTNTIRFSHALPALPTSRNKPSDLRHLCAAMWKNTPNTCALLMVKGQFFSRHAPFISKALKAPSRHLNGLRREDCMKNAVVTGYHIFGKLLGYANNEVLWKYFA